MRNRSRILSVFVLSVYLMVIFNVDFADIAHEVSHIISGKLFFHNHHHHHHADEQNDQNDHVHHQIVDDLISKSLRYENKKKSDDNDHLHLLVFLKDQRITNKNSTIELFALNFENTRSHMANLKSQIQLQPATPPPNI